MERYFVYGRIYIELESGPSTNVLQTLTNLVFTSNMITYKNVRVSAHYRNMEK